MYRAQQYTIYMYYIHLTLRALMSHICDISPLRGSPATRSCPNACNWRQAQVDERG